jgi:hypothetical protein
MPDSKLVLRSALAPWIEKFIAQKQACGYKYAVESDSLRRLDRFLQEQGLQVVDLPRPLVERWIARGPTKASGTSRPALAWSGGWPPS